MPFAPFLMFGRLLLLSAVLNCGITLQTAAVQTNGASPNEPSSIEAPKNESVHLKSIPFIQAVPDFGGEACAASYLQFLGNRVDADFVFDQSSLDPRLGRGCATPELALSLKRCGVQVGSVWLDANSDEDLAKIFQSIHRDLKQKQPSIVLVNLNRTEKFVLVTGYDADKDELIYHNPNRRDGDHMTVDRALFLRSMRRIESNAAYRKQAIVFACRGGRKDLKVTDEPFTDADYAQHIRDLKQKLPNDQFSIVLQKPFVVVGDGGREQVKRTAEKTVQWAVDRIKQDYFKKDPNTILDIWLFKDATSYNKHNVELFGSKPSTPYGYYSSHHKALVMDISTGGGTLVHEIVHPFIESNFPQCPSWFNEGLASLYEQSSSRNGKIVGLTNWRLRGLQQTIRAERLPSFKSLCETTTREFYQSAGTNYAQARYLCYYLQEQGRLRKFYHQFNRNVNRDPGGFETLKSVLETDDIDTFQKEWERYVLKLKF